MSTLSWMDYQDQVSVGRLLRVVNFHNTPANMAATLRRQFSDLARDFETIGPRQLECLFKGETWIGGKPPLALVFYEGYANHAAVAAPLLEELGLTAWFLIPTAFPSVPPHLQEEFADAHYLGIVDEERGSQRLALSWEEIAELAQRHVIAPHTATHARLDTIVTAEDVRREIVEPYEAVLAVTGTPPAATAFLFGAPVDGYPAIEHVLKETGYQFVFANTKLQRLSESQSATQG